MYATNLHIGFIVGRLAAAYCTILLIILVTSLNEMCQYLNYGLDIELYWIYSTNRLSINNSSFGERRNNKMVGFKIIDVKIRYGSPLYSYSNTGQ